MNYEVTEVHNNFCGEDNVWFNVEITDLNETQKNQLLELLMPLYSEDTEKERIECEKARI